MYCLDKPKKKPACIAISQNSEVLATAWIGFRDDGSARDPEVAVYCLRDGKCTYLYDKFR